MVLSGIHDAHMFLNGRNEEMTLVILTLQIRTSLLYCGEAMRKLALFLLLIAPHRLMFSRKIIIMKEFISDVGKR